MYQVLLLLVACREDPSPPGDGGEAELVSATCTPDADNALRATCELTLSAPGLAEVEVTDGVEVAVFATTEPELAPRVPIWGLTAESTWTFTARAASDVDAAGISGEITLGPLPEAIRFTPNLDRRAASALVQVLAPMTCDRVAHAVVLDAEGRVRWYAPLGGREADILQLTEVGTVLAAFDRSEVVELDLAGGEHLRWTSPLPVHHEVFRRNDRIYVLAADAYPADDGQTYVEDVVLALDLDGAEVWRWEQHEWLDARLAGGVPDGFWSNEFPGAIDAWHTNGMFVTEDDDLVLSLKKHSVLMRVSGDDGAVEWMFAGDGAGDPYPTDVTLLPSGQGDPRFHDQHHPALLPGGGLTVFDNGNNRGLELALDESALTASYVADWPLPLTCPIQSSVYALDEANGVAPGGVAGHHLVTCASAAIIAEYDAAGEQVGGFAPSCDNGAMLPLMIRGQPVDVWGGWRAGGVDVSRRR
jgi:hypothetical protein